MAITLDGTNGITTPDLESSGPVIGTTGTFSGNVSGVAGTFSGAVQASGVTTNLYPLVSETAKSATGATVQFTSIPSWVKRITVMFNEISTNGSSNVQIQLGDSGGYETSGYTGTAWLANTVNTAMSAGFLITATNSSTYTWNGSVILTNFGSNTWILQGSVGISSVAAGGVQNGKKTLSDVLTQLQITTVNGTDTFDAGTINIMYE
jgi:hypothetical protein